MGTRLAYANLLDFYPVWNVSQPDTTISVRVARITIDRQPYDRTMFIRLEFPFILGANATGTMEAFGIRQLLSNGIPYSNALGLHLSNVTTTDYAINSHMWGLLDFIAYYAGGPNNTFVPTGPITGVVTIPGSEESGEIQIPIDLNLRVSAFASPSGIPAQFSSSIYSMQVVMEADREDNNISIDMGTNTWTNN